jgi:hypothetical protein
MPIKNKDGSVYKLRGPNPLMKTQKKWEKSDFKLHNFDWKSEAVENNEEINPIDSDFEVNQETNVVVEPLPEPEPKIEPEENRPKVVTSIKKDALPPEEELSPAMQNKIQAYCLPALIHNDSLYGETRVGRKYGTKFTFEAILMEHNGFAMLFWSGIQMEKGSIIYPQIKEKRWWKIIASEEKAGGFIYQLIPSDVQPDFS